MAYLNKVMLIGNLGKDPEIRVSQIGGRKSVSFSIATSRTRKTDFPNSRNSRLVRG